MESLSLGSLIFWEGIHYLTKVNEPSMQNMRDWIDYLLNPNVDLFIQLFSFSSNNSQIEDQEANNNTILVAFSYIKDSKHHVFILHTFQPFSFLVFVHPFFNKLREILENNKRSKIVIDKEHENITKNTFLEYFKVKIHGIESSFENNQNYQKLFEEKHSQIGSILNSFLSKQSDKYNEEFVDCVKNIKIDLKGDKCLTKEEKQFYSTIILCILQISSSNRNPSETNRHLIVP